MFGIKKKSKKAKETANEAVESVQDAVQAPVKKTKDKSYQPLTKLLNEADFLSLSEVFEKNEKFITEDKYWCILFDADELGFCNKRNLKKNGDYGSFLQLVETGGIDIYTDAKLLEGDKFAVIPTAGTVEELKSFMFLYDKKFDIAGFDKKTGEWESIGKQISYADLVNMYDADKADINDITYFLNDEAKKKEETITKRATGEIDADEVYKRLKDEPETKEAKEDKESEVIDDLGTDEVQDEETDAEPILESDGSEFFTDGEFESDAPEYDTQETDSYEEEPDEETDDLTDEDFNEETADGTSVPSDELEEETFLDNVTSSTDIIKEAETYVTLANTGNSLTVTSEAFDSIFLQDLDTRASVFGNVEVPDGVSENFIGELNTRITMADNKLRTSYKDTLLSFRNEYMILLTEIANRASSELSWQSDNVSDRYHVKQMYDNALKKYRAARADAGTKTQSRIKALSDEYEEERKRFVEERTREAEAEFRRINEANFKLKKDSVKDDVDMEIRLDNDAQIKALNGYIENTFWHIADVATRNLLDAFRIKIDDFMATRRKEIDAEYDELRKFINAHAGDDLERSRLKNELKKQKAAEEDRMKGYENEIERLSASRAEIQAEAEKTYEERIKLLETQLKNANAQLDTTIARHADERKGLTDSIEALKEANKQAVANTSSEVALENEKAQRAIENANKQNKHITTVMGWLMLAIGVSSGAVGALIGFFVAH